MELNLLTGSLVVLLMVYMAYSRVKMLIDHKTALDSASSRGKFEKIFTGKANLTIYTVVLITAVIGSIFIYANRAEYDNYTVWFMVFSVIVITSATDIIRTFVLYTTYFNDNGIFHDTQYIRYSSIKNFKPKRIPITTDVYLFNGEMHTLPTKALILLEDRIKAKKI